MRRLGNVGALTVLMNDISQKNKASLAFDVSDVASGSAAMPMYFATSHELNAFQHEYASATVTNDLNFGSTFTYLRAVRTGMEREQGRGVRWAW